MKFLLLLILAAGLGYYYYDSQEKLKAADLRAAQLQVELEQREPREKADSSHWFAQRMQERPTLEPPNRLLRKPERYDDEARRRAGGSALDRR